MTLRPKGIFQTIGSVFAARHGSDDQSADAQTDPAAGLIEQVAYELVNVGRIEHIATLIKMSAQLSLVRTKEIEQGDPCPHARGQIVSPVMAPPIDRGCKFRLRGYGYDLRETQRGTVLTTLPHGVEVCTLD